MQCVTGSRGFGPRQIAAQADNAVAQRQTTVYEEVESEIQQRILGSRQQAALRAYLTKMRDLSFLEIKAGFEDTGAAPSKDTTWQDPAQLKPETITKEDVLKQNPGMKRVLGVIPIPGTKSTGSSSSR